MPARSGEKRYDSIGVAYAHWRAAQFYRGDYRSIVDRIPEPCRLAADVGCGSGPMTAVLAEHSRRVVGLDPSWTMLLLAREHLARRGTANAWLVRGDAECLPVREGCTDFAVVLNALHHTDARRTLAELRRVLAPEGRLALRALVVARFRRPTRWLPVRLAWAVLRVLDAARRHGPRVGLASARFFLGLAWLPSTGRKPSPAELAAQCEEAFPGCRIGAPRGGQVTVLWPAPEGPAAEP